MGTTTRRGALKTALVLPTATWSIGADRPARTLRVVGGRSEKHVAAETVQTLSTHGVSVYAVAPARQVADRSRPVLRNPLTGGRLHADLSDGTVVTEGGVGFSARTESGVRQVEFTGLTADLGGGRLSGAVAVDGERSACPAVLNFRLSEGSITAGADRFRFDAVPLLLTEASATALNDAFGAAMVTPGQALALEFALVLVAPGP